VQACGGVSLAPAVRAKFEATFGADLSGVRVHADERAAREASDLGAGAYTTGSDIFFGAGRYRPATRDGAWLLSHELAHVLQQRPDAPDRRAILVSRPGDLAEREASRAADDVLAGRIPRVSARSEPLSVQRQMDGPGPSLAVLKNPKQVRSRFEEWNLVRRVGSPGHEQFVVIADAPALAAAMYRAAQMGIPPDIFMDQFYAMVSESQTEREHETSSTDKEPAKKQSVVDTPVTKPGENISTTDAPKKEKEPAEVSFYAGMSPQFAQSTIGYNPGAPFWKHFSSTGKDSSTSSPFGVQVTKPFTSKNERSALEVALFAEGVVDKDGKIRELGGGAAVDITRKLNKVVKVKTGGDVSIHNNPDDPPPGEAKTPVNVEAGINAGVVVEPRDGTTITVEGGWSKSTDPHAPNVSAGITLEITLKAARELLKKLGHYIRHGKKSKQIDDAYSPN
jgi:uncharacterized protein DUF4157